MISKRLPVQPHVDVSCNKLSFQGRCFNFYKKDNVNEISRFDLSVINNPINAVEHVTILSVFQYQI